MPHPLEFPRMLRAVVPLMGTWDAVVHELVAFGFGKAVWPLQLLSTAAWAVPGLTSIIGTLNDLTEPGTGLRYIDPVRISRRTFEVINFPSGKMRSIDLPI